MKRHLAESLYIFLQGSIPLICSILFILLNSIYVCGINLTVRPMIGFMCVFFWLNNRPDLFNFCSVVILAVLCDLLNFTPNGVYAFSFLLVYVINLYLSKYVTNKYFSVNFLFFTLLSLFVLIIQWGLISVSHQTFINILPNIISWVLSVCFYPLFAMVNLKIMEKFSLIGDFK